MIDLETLTGFLSATFVATGVGVGDDVAVGIGVEVRVAGGVWVGMMGVCVTGSVGLICGGVGRREQAVEANMKIITTSRL